jgi:ABC-type antimicrobial peptide transport system permease subunit
MAYTVSQRTNEFGIRLALGALRGQIRGMVLREAAWIAVSGVALGAAATLLLARLVQAMLFGVKPYDPVSLAGSGMLLLGLALLASFVPAQRATLIDPMEAMRNE